MQSALTRYVRDISFRTDPFQINNRKTTIIMTNNHLPALCAIQYSEFDISKGARVYYEVNDPAHLVADRFSLV